MKLKIYEKPKTNWNYIMVVVISSFVVFVLVWNYASIDERLTLPERFTELRISRRAETPAPNVVLDCSNLKFEDFPVSDIYEGVAVAVDFESAPEYKLFRTVVTAGAKLGPNFAGRYTVVTWGCGTACQSNVVIDVGTGKILDNFPSSGGSQYDLQSRLLIADTGDSPGLSQKYYEFKDGKFKLLCEFDK